MTGVVTDGQIAVLLAVYLVGVGLTFLGVRTWYLYRLATDEDVLRRIVARRNCDFCSADYTCGPRHRVPNSVRPFWLTLVMLGWPLSMPVLTVGWLLNRAGSRIAAKAAKVHNERVEHEKTIAAIEELLG
jgi:hypothetical protein